MKPTALLLHGLFGYGAEWAETASWLSQTHEVIAPDAPGHGENAHDADVSRAAHVAAAAARLKGPALVVGHSLGGHTAFLLAARHPELVTALVAAETTPAARPGIRARVDGYIAGRPEHFTSCGEELAFYGGDSLRARTWADAPPWERETMLRCVEELEHAWWDDWKAITCAILVVRARNDGIDATRMLELQPAARLAELDGGHDVHLDDPGGWRAAIERFL